MADFEPDISSSRSLPIAGLIGEAIRAASDDDVTRRKAEVLRQLFLQHRIRKVLDLGCRGLETVLHALPIDQIEYVGVYFSDQPLEPQRKILPNLQFIKREPYSVENLAGCPDLVICFDLLERIEDERTYARLCEFIFNCGAKAAAVTRSADGQKSRNEWTRSGDIGESVSELHGGYVRKIEWPCGSRRIVSLDLSAPVADRESTDIVYVCSPDRESQLFTSLGTLLRSGTLFDRVVIFCVGLRPQSWRFHDPRVVVQEVPPLFGDYFYANKLYLCTRSAFRVVFLDTDTLILRPLELLWQDKDVDLIARIASVYNSKDWERSVWRETCHEIGADTEVPMFNSGLVVFQHHAHRRIQSAWSSCISKYLKGDFVRPTNDVRMPDQFGLSLAVGSERLSYGLLDSRNHTFGWDREDYSQSFVLHTGNRDFDIYTLESGLATAPLLTLDSPDMDSMRIHDNLERANQGLKNRLLILEKQLKDLKRSKIFAVRQLLSSLQLLISALCRLDRIQIRRHAGALSRSLTKLTAHKPLLL